MLAATSPVSSSTSRCAAASAFSPGSMNPPTGARDVPVKPYLRAVRHQQRRREKKLAELSLCCSISFSEHKHRHREAPP